MKRLRVNGHGVATASLLSVIALAFAALPAAASWDNWDCNLRCYWGALDGTPADVICFFGVRPTATDGYDPILPEPCKPVPQGNYVFAWFDRSGWGTCPRAEDYRSPIPEGASKVWGPGLTDTWNVKTNLGAGWSGLYDDCTGELEYPVAASIYITWVFGAGESPSPRLPPGDYAFTMQYKGGVNAKPAGTKLADAIVPTMNQTWEMEATPQIVIALWPEYFQPYRPDCAGFEPFDVAKFKFIVNNPDTVPYCDIAVDPPTPQPPLVTYTFTATACCDEPFAFYWDFGDGGTATGNPVTHTYAAAGVYAVICTVADVDGDVAVCTWEILLVDCPMPVCCFTYIPEAPRAYADTVEFTDCSTPGAPECSIDSWQWDFGDGGTSDQQDPSHLYLAQGTYTVCLLVMSGPSPALCCQEITVHPPPEPPLCEVTADPPDPMAGEAVTFTMGGMCCPAPGLTYDWDFDCDGTVDATTFEVNTASHVYAAAGNYTACAAVSDGGGLLCEAFVDVVVSPAPLPPVCCFSGPSEITIGQEACWDDCSTDPDGFIVSEEWTLDGSPVGSGPQFCRTFSGGDLGVHTLTLCVVDDDGLSACCSLEMAGLCPPPDCGELVADPVAADVGDTVTFTQLAPACGAPFTYDWDFECDGAVDATTVDVNTATHVYTSPGDYVACVKVTNSLGQWCEAFVDVHVNAPPVCAFTRSPAAAYVCDLFEFDGSGSSDPDGVIVGWDWDFGDGAVGSGETISHRYSAPGVYSVTLTVTDDDGNAAQCSDSVVVWAGSDVDWNCNLRCYWGALDGSPRDTECFFGVKPGATDGYDMIDSLKPAEPGGDYVYAWFYRPAWGAPSTNVKEDWRSPIPEGTSKVWGPGITDTWNVKTNLDNGPSGYFDANCDPLNELEYPVAASIYITWEFGVSETPPGPVPPADYIFAMQYKGGISAKPPGTKLPDATVPAVNQIWDMETTPQIVVPLWEDAFQPFTAECGMAAPDTAKFKFIVTNPQVPPPLACQVTIGGARECGAPLTFNANAAALYGVASIAWDFGDGATATGDQVTHAYAAPGGYLVTCTVTDECGLTAECDYSLVIEPTTVSFSLTGPAWHMVALPCDIADPDPAVVFDELDPWGNPGRLSGCLHRYDPIGGGYRTWYDFSPGGFGGPLRIGEGYWLWAHEDVTIDYEACCPPGERAIHFPVPGWYIIGNPCPHLVDMRTDQAQAECGDSGRIPYRDAVPYCFGDPLIGYDPTMSSYYYVWLGNPIAFHDLRPFEGYWIYVNVAPSTLYFMCSEAPP